MRPISALVAAIVLGSLGQAQPSARPSFEVASVKLNPNCANGRGFSDGSPPGSLNLTCASLARLVQLAYVTFAGAKMNPVHLQVIGGPRWMDSEQFDIAARAPGDPPQGQMYGPMLQVLLEDRFQLKLHSERRELPVYNLMVAGGGIKIQPMKEGGCTAMDVHHPPPPASGQSPAEFCGNFSMRRANGLNILDAYGFSISGFGSVVSGTLLDRPVNDKTGVTGTFDIHLEFAPDTTKPSIGPPRGSVDNPSTPSPDNLGPSIFTAMQEQLGLKLEPAKGPVEVIVIDHSEHPSAN
jgi:uncharacterized protein (TIGR03435 family)